jgi:hypothetical protein
LTALCPFTVEAFDVPGIDIAADCFTGEEARGVSSSSLDESSAAARLRRKDFAGVTGSDFGAVTWDCAK